MSSAQSLACIFAAVAIGLFLAAILFSKSQDQYEESKAQQRYKSTHRRTREIERRRLVRPEPIGNETQEWPARKDDWSEWYR